MSHDCFTHRQVQAMVDRAYALALNDAAGGIVQPWQDHVPSVHDLRRDLIEAGTWPKTRQEGPV